MKDEQKKKSKKEKLKEVLPFFQSSYQHMYDVREGNIQNAINILLIVATFLPIACITLYAARRNWFILLPVVFQISALLLLLKSYFVEAKPYVHWFKLDKTLKDIDDGEFETAFLGDLKALEQRTNITKNIRGKMINHSLHLIIFSIYLAGIGVFDIFVRDRFVFYVFAIGFTVISVFFVKWYYFRKEESDSTQFEQDNRKEIAEWAEKNGSKSKKGF